MDAFALALDLVGCAQVLAVDTETTGLDPHADRLVGIVIAAAGHSLYFPTAHQSGNCLEDPALFYRQLARGFALRSRLGLRTVFHKASFDLWFLTKVGIHIDAPIEDTLINAVLLQDNLYQYNLDACCERAGLPGKDSKELLELLARFDRKGAKHLMKHFHKLPGDHPLVHDYACQDGHATLMLWEHQQPLIEERGLQRVHALECKLIPHLARMRRRGLRIDQSYGPQALTAVADELERLRLPFPVGFSPNKPGEVLAWLRSQGVGELPSTPTGKPSTAKEVLEGIAPGRQVLSLRRMEKLESAFLRPMLGPLCHEGRIHPELVQSKNDAGKGTHTGRFSCVDPNLQQVPKRRREIAARIRPLIAADPGFVLAESDVSQQEVRLYAHYAEEERLLAAYLADPPIDVHSVTRDLLGLPPTKEARDLAKQLGLSIFNGMQAQSVSIALGCTPEEAQSYINRFLQGYPRIARFMQAAPVGAAVHGYVRTALGRICHLGYWERKIAVSRVIQGSGADQMKLLLLRACEYEVAHPEVQILMPIHDSLLWQARQGFDTREFERVLEDNSELYQIIDGKRVPMRVPFPMETRKGRHWGEASGVTETPAKERQHA